MARRTATNDRSLRQDVADMIKGTRQNYNKTNPEDIARDIIVIVRAATLAEVRRYVQSQELESVSNAIL